MNKDKALDCLIIGGGPSALIAGVYIKRALKKVEILTDLIGGQIYFSNNIENWPGEISISGKDLIKKMRDQFKKYDGKINMGKAKEIYKRDEIFHVICESGKEFKAKIILLCTGARVKKLGIENEDKLFGVGVHSCAACDGNFYMKKEVAVLGGGNKGAEEALLLSNLCSQVFLIHRREELKAEKILQDAIFNNKKIKLILGKTVKSIRRDKSIVLRLTDESEIIVEGLFLAIGNIPNSEFVDVDKDEAGYVKVDHNFETSIRGMFAAGEISDGRYRQLTTSVGYATSASLNIIRRLDEISNIS